MFDECRDDELMAVTCGDVEGGVSVPVHAINLGSYKHINETYAAPMTKHKRAFGSPGLYRFE